MKNLPKDSQDQAAYIASDIKPQGAYSLKKIPCMVTFKFIEKSSELYDKIRYWSYAAKYNFARCLLEL